MSQVLVFLPSMREVSVLYTACGPSKQHALKEQTLGGGGKALRFGIIRPTRRIVAEARGKSSLSRGGQSAVRKSRARQMQIVERSVGDVTILDLKGRLLLGEGDEEFRDTVDRLVQLGRRKVLLNLDEVTHIDSAGLGMMVSKYITLIKRDGQLKLCHLHLRSFRVLNVTKLLTVFESFSSEAEAIESFDKKDQADS
jgi:anti-sigma B factor antagonist